MEDQSNISKDAAEITGLQEKDTQELVDLWKKHTQMGTTDETGEKVRRILIERLGSVPESPEEISHELDEDDDEEEESGTFHDRPGITRIATTANVLSWVIVVIVSLIFILNLVSAFQTGVFKQSMGFLSLLNPLIVVLIGLFGFVLLQAIAEGIYVLLDIEDNTHRAAYLSKRPGRE